MEAHLFGLKKTAFILWRPRHTQVTPKLVLGQFQPGNPPTLGNRREFELEQMPEHTDLWGISAGACSLTDGQVYHYWFEVTDSSPFRDGRRILCTDPTAFTIDWRLLADRLPAPYDVNDQDPAAVVKFENGQLVPCDAAGETFAPASTISADKAQPNNRIVIYELPTTWTKINVEGNPQIGVGTFRDVLALVRTEAEPMNFDGIRALERGRSHLQRLGVNALELLPLADSFVDREWGYATSNYFAPDFDLGFPSGNSSPTSNTDLIELITACHDLGIRFIIDVVMAFGTRAALENVNFDDFHIDPKLTPQDPDTQQSTGQGTRDGFGGRLWRYARIVSSYDPVAGTSGNFSPARQLMKAYLLRWLSDFAVDGVRMDSVNNIANWDFVQEFKESRPPTLAGQRRDGRQIPRRGRRAFCAAGPAYPKPPRWSLERGLQTHGS
jgi:pullulanase